MNSSIHLCNSIHSSYSYSPPTAITFFKRVPIITASGVSPARVRSLPFDIPRLLLVSMENVPRMVNPLCASIPRSIASHGKAVRGHGYTGVTTQLALIPSLYNRHSLPVLHSRRERGADSVFTGARNNSSPVLVPPIHPNDTKST